MAVTSFALEDSEHTMVVTSNVKFQVLVDTSCCMATLFTYLEPVCQVFLS